MRRCYWFAQGTRNEMLICCLSHMLPGFQAACLPYLGYPETYMK